MRNCLFFAFLVAPAVFAHPSYTEYARLLETYVEGDSVRYEAWAANESDQESLDEVMRYFAGVDVDALDRAEQTAFYINLYNAAMLDVVFDHYPIDSVTQIGEVPFSVFKTAFIRQGGRMLSLDDVEKDILLKEYFDPRIHFGVNCASVSCPPLRAEPFYGARLDEQLDEQARLYADGSHGARVDAANKSTAYSELFTWYADDFGGKNPASYLNRYRSVPLPVDYAVDWIKYDWSLNTAKMPN